MRKLFLLVVIVMAAITASAQEGIYLGGGISLWRNNDVDKTSFSITPDVGYNLSEKWAVGVELAYAHKVMMVKMQRMAIGDSPQSKKAKKSSTRTVGNLAREKLQYRVIIRITQCYLI